MFKYIEYYRFVMSDKNKSVAVFKALADTTRLEMVRQLARCPTGKKTCGDLSSDSILSQPAMSHHFGKLVNAGVVLETKSGVQKAYELNKRLFEQIGLDITKL